jgi:hypothetical protein
MLKKIGKKKVKIIFKSNSYIVLLKGKVFVTLPVIVTKLPVNNISRRLYTYLVLLKILRNFGIVKSLYFKHDFV